MGYRMSILVGGTSHGEESQKASPCIPTMGGLRSVCRSYEHRKKVKYDPKVEVSTIFSRFDYHMIGVLFKSMKILVLNIQVIWSPP